ncbi:MAG TPA: DUF1015 domain-containing protein, partial [Dehalococcoidia bacterium]|nr:DUF1015 domain-containing protein [Dehalococcoidia bacterium]
MTDVRPFRGVRFDPSVVGDWGAVLGPPYDIITGEQVEMLRRRHANQIQHIESASGEAGTAEAARVFGDWRRSGVLQQEAAPAYYLAEHEFSHEGAQHSRTSLYAAVRLTPWAAGEVFAHEWTMPGPREERMRLRQTVRADVSPLMALLPDRSGTIAGIMEDAREVAPTATGTDYADERHTLRVLDDPTQVEALRSALAADKVYMADGHHRYEAALAYRDQCAAEAGASWTGEEPENFVLMGLIVAGDPGLLLGGTHRVLHVPAPADTLARLEQVFAVQDLGSRRTGVDVGYLLQGMRSIRDDGPTIGVAGLDGDRLHLLLSGESTRAAMPNTVPTSWSTLDAALLQYAVLEPIFAVTDAALRAGLAVTYTHDAAAAWAEVFEGDAT